MTRGVAMHRDPTLNEACSMEARDRRAASVDHVMTQHVMVSRMTAVLNARRCNQAKVRAERKNIAEWFVDCEESSTDQLLEKRAYLREVIRFARDTGDVFYYETRSLYLDIVNEFLSPKRVGEGSV